MKKKFEEFKKPFPAKDVEWRIQRAGEKNGKVWAQALAYITARAVMDRLDSVVGGENWYDEYTEAPNNVSAKMAAEPVVGVKCRLHIRIDGEWICKEGLAENTQIEPIKGGESSALKRAAVKVGIGRYLYNLDICWADTRKDKARGYTYGSFKDKKTKKNITFFWKPPVLPSYALPDGDKTQPKTEPPPPPADTEEQQKPKPKPQTALKKFQRQIINAYNNNPIMKKITNKDLLLDFNKILLETKQKGVKDLNAQDRQDVLDTVEHMSVITKLPSEINKSLKAAKKKKYNEHNIFTLPQAQWNVLKKAAENGGTK